MSYLSPEFALVFFLFLVLYWSLVKWPVAQKLSLLVASYGIYASIDWRFAAVLAVYSSCISLTSQLVTWRPALRRSLPAIAITLSVANLAVFKYFDFFREGMQGLAEFFHWQWAIPALDIILPVGISFYTFQSITYLVALARGEREPASWLDGSLYLAFFPTLFAGPICRPSGLLSQLEAREQREIQRPALAICLLLSAMIKKVWLASWLADTWVKPLFANPDAYQGLELLVGMYAFAIQIYFDFSGYSDLVIALALLLGYRLSDNFNQPYLATSLREFWRRWHISLSTWIRDYVYIPMGGNRGGWWMTQMTIFNAMLISGLWHGASLKYLIWGALHGLGMVLQNGFERITGKRVQGIAGAVFSFHFVCLAWVFFRAENWQEALNYLAGLTRADGPLQMNVMAGFLLLGVFFAGALGYERWQGQAVRWLEKTPLPLQVLLITLTVLLINYLGPSGVPAFLYYSY